MRTIKDFNSTTNLVVAEYKKHLKLHNSNLPEPIAKAVIRLVNGESVTAKEFEEDIRKYLA